MTVGKIKEIALYQTANDIDDIDDFETVLQPYLDEAYDMAVFAFTAKHAGTDEYPALVRDEDTPALPSWMHIKLADWVSWRILADGSPARQQRGMVFRQSFDEAIRALKGESVAGRSWSFKGIPDEGVLAR